MVKNRDGEITFYISQSRILLQGVLDLGGIQIPSSDNGDNLRSKRVHNIALNIIIGQKK
jgi:hypothetical protein